MSFQIVPRLHGNCFLNQHPTHSHNLHRKVFIGGLLPSIGSDYLKDFCEAKFGPVEEAVVVGAPKGEHMQSRGFGFVIFKKEEAVATAVKSHFVTILGKRVEIKRAFPETVLSAELPTPPQQHQQPQQSELNENTEESREILQVINSDIQTGGIVSNQNLPPWFIKFKHWFPGFLQEVSEQLGEGEWYPLSSLKGDFRATCRMELDHSSLGFLKLSDFIRSLQGICRMRVVPVGTGAATHMVLLPPWSGPQHHPLPTPPPHQQQKQQSFLDANDSSSLTDHIIASPASPPLQPIRLQQTSPISQSGKDKYWLIESLLSEEGYSGEGILDPKEKSDDEPSPSERFLQFLVPSNIDIFVGKHPLQKNNGGDSPSRGDLCLYCKPQSATVVIGPCGHKVLCESCKVNKLPLKCLSCGGTAEGFYPGGLAHSQMANAPVSNALKNKENYLLQEQSTPSACQSAIPKFGHTWTSLTPSIKQTTACMLSKSSPSTGSTSSSGGTSVGKGTDEKSSNISCNKRDLTGARFLR